MISGKNSDSIRMSTLHQVVITVGNKKSNQILFMVFSFKKIILDVALIILNISCSEEQSSAPESGTRIGAVCKDGTRTDATGSGACSHHGGVDHWLYR